MTVPPLTNRWHCTQYRQTPEDRWGSGMENKVKLHKNHSLGKNSPHYVLIRWGQNAPGFSHLSEEGRALLGHLCCVLVELQRPRELVHEYVGLVGVILCKILHLIFQEHQAAVPSIQLVPHMLRNKKKTIR